MRERESESACEREDLCDSQSVVLSADLRLESLQQKKTENGQR